MSTDPEATTTRKIKRFAPLQLGKMMGVLYAIMGLIFCPFFLLMSLFAPKMPPGQGAGMMVLGTGFALFLPVIYGVLGFIGGVISAFIYNIIAKWIGGIEVEVE